MIARLGLGRGLLAVGAALLALTALGALSQWRDPDDHITAYTVTLVQVPLYAVAAWLLLARGRDSVAKPERALVTILLFGLAMRLILLPVDPISTDAWRYIWDGRVLAAGINPYLHLPSDEALSALRDDAVYPNINRVDYAPTIYAPAAQIVFFLVTRLSESMLVMKAAMAGFEAVAIWALLQLLAARGLPRTHVLLYVWHPLPLWELAGNGHVDAVALAFLLVAFVAADRRWPVLAGAALAAGTFVKYLPIVTAPAIYKRWDWRLPLAFVGTAALLYVPYLDAGAKVIGFLGGYMIEEGMTDGAGIYLWALVRSLVSLPTDAHAFYFPIAAVALIALAAVLFFRRDEPGADLAVAMCLAVTAMVLLSPHWPWYFVWLIPFVCFHPSWAVIYLTGASSILHLVVSPPSVSVQSVLYVPFFLILIAEALYRRSANLEKRRGRAIAA